MKKNQSLLTVVALTFIVAISSGCSQNQQKTSSTTPSEVTTEQSSQEPSASPSPEIVKDTTVDTQSNEITITDGVGRAVTLTSPAKKLVGTHNPTMNQAIILGGGGKYIAGFGNKNMASGLYGFVFPELKDVPQIGQGKDINYEECLAVGADLAILPERFKDQADKYEEVGIKAAVVLPNVESFDTIKSSLRMVGKLVGENERAEKIVSFFDSKISTAKEIAKKADAKPNVLYLGGSSPLSVANGVMLQSVMLETVGATNVAKDVPGQGDFIEVTIEEIIGWNPEVIYVPMFAKYSVDDILNDASWSSVKAVQDKKVFMFPSKLEAWDYPTPSAAMGLTWLLNNLYPELYSMDQVIKDANEYYEMVYGQSFTAEQLGLN